MNIYDVVCGICASHDFKYIDGEYRCSGCGHILSDDEIYGLLSKAQDDYIKTNNNSLHL